MALKFENEKKTCQRCGKEKTRGDFYKHADTRDGKQAKCKDCMRELANARYRRIISERVSTI